MRARMHVLSKANDLSLDLGSSGSPPLAGGADERGSNLTRWGGPLVGAAPAYLPDDEVKEPSDEAGQDARHYRSAEPCLMFLRVTAFMCHL